MIYFAEIGEGGPIKIGQSRYPWRRIQGLASFHKKNIVLIAQKAGGYETEFALHSKFEKYLLVGMETYNRADEIMTYLEKYRLAEPIIHIYRTKAESKRGPSLMTAAVVDSVGKLLNSGMTGPAVAKKLGVSTASVYAFWKQSGKGRFVRKRKSVRNDEKI